MSGVLSCVEIEKIRRVVEAANYIFQWGGKNGSLTTKNIQVKSRAHRRWHVGTIRIGTSEWFAEAGWKREEMGKLVQQLAQEGIILTEAP